MLFTPGEGQTLIVGLDVIFLTTAVVDEGSIRRPDCKSQPVSISPPRRNRKWGKFLSCMAHGSTSPV
jgi:hypothetical protein